MLVGMVAFGMFRHRYRHELRERSLGDGAGPATAG
jgi:hypothetical protein